jgi:hypothetical protein
LLDELDRQCGRLKKNERKKERKKERKNILLSLLTVQTLAQKHVCIFNFSIIRSSYLHRASIVSKTLFIIPADAQYYKSVDMLKRFKSQFLPFSTVNARLLNRPICRTEKKNISVVLAKHKTAP